MTKQDQQDSDTDYEDNSNPTDSSRALYFLNNLCIESQQEPSPSLVHSSSRQSFQQQQQQQPLFVLNNGYMTQSNQSLPASSSKPSTTTYYYLKTNEDFSEQNRRQSISTVQQPPKMGVKALNHNSSSKVRHSFRGNVFLLNC